MPDGLPLFPLESNSRGALAAVNEETTGTESRSSFGTSRSEDVFSIFRDTSLNAFRLFRRFFSSRFPDRDPVENAMLEDVVSGTVTQLVSEATAVELSHTPATRSLPVSLPAAPVTAPMDSMSGTLPTTITPPRSSKLAPYPNFSAFQLHGEYYWNGNLQKSKGDFKYLVNTILAKDFKVEELRDINWELIDRQLVQEDDNNPEYEDIRPLEADGAHLGWQHTEFSINVPNPRRNKQPGVHSFPVGKLSHRSLIDVMTDCLTNERKQRQSTFNYVPYELRFQAKPGGESIQTFGELYTSPAWLEAHAELQASPHEEECTLERVLLPVIFASDETRLTTHGDVKLWPVYMYYAGDSKYDRGCPQSRLCEHVAYFQTVRPLSITTINIF